MFITNTYQWGLKNIVNIPTMKSNQFGYLIMSNIKPPFSKM